MELTCSQRNCGFGDSVAYETLVSKLARARIDKSSRFTDWSLRPLSERQIAYAIADVTHLRPVYEKLEKRLASNGREGWLDEEMATLTAPTTYAVAPEAAFRRIKARAAKPRMLAVLRELAAWREREAQTRDLPRNRVMRDESLVEIAHHTPKTAQDLSRTRGLGKKFAEGPQGKAVLEAVARGLAVPDADCPQPPRRQEQTRNVGPAVDLLKVLLKMKCAEAGVAQRLVATSDDLDMVATQGEKADVAVLHGWRRKLSGEIALAVDGKNIELVDVEEDEDESGD